MYSIPTSSVGRKDRGIALVAALLIIVIMTFLVISYLTLTRFDLMVSESYSNNLSSDELAKGALSTIKDSLLEEIKAGSDVDTQQDVNLYSPTSNRTSQPARFLQPGSEIGAANQPIFPALLRRSATASNRSTRQPSGFAADYTNFPTTLDAAPILTSEPSANSRSISAERWNKPLFMNPADLGSFQLPEWIYWTPDGPTDDATNPEVVGRVAYVIYDTSGLLDINVAGNDLPAADNLRKGRLHQADLSIVPLKDPAPGAPANAAAALDLVAWRFKTTKADASEEAASNGLFDPERNFVTPAPGDDSFVNRQDLLTYAKENGLRDEAMTVLTTFSREKNAPSFSPNPSRPKVVSGTAGNPNTVGKDDDFNPDFLDLRDSSGAHLVKKRFPLSRLAWLTESGPAPTATPEDIKTYFGLVWNASNRRWIYTSPDGGSNPTSSIKFLKDIPPARANSTGPDFFELLQAGISVGSLGKAAGPAGGFNNPSSGIGSDVEAADQNTFHQLMRIGANVIDQYDADSYPTTIDFGGLPMYGTEDLPYPSRAFMTLLRTSAPITLKGFWIIEVWNPHQNLSSSAGPRPTQFQVSGVPGSGSSIHAPFGVYGPTYDISTSTPISFSSNATQFRSPTRLGSTNSTTSVQNNGGSATAQATGSTHEIYGLYAGSGTVSNFGWISPSPSTTIALEYEKGGQFYPYAEWRDLANSEIAYAFTQSGGGSYFGTLQGYTHSDPRTDRFGTSNYYAGYSVIPQGPGTGTIWPSPSSWPFKVDFFTPQESYGLQRNETTTRCVQR